MFSLKKQRSRGKGIQIPFAAFLQILATARVVPGQNQEPVSQSRCTVWAAGTQYFSQHLPPPRVHISRKLQSEVVLGLKPDIPKWDVGVPSVT